MEKAKHIFNTAIYYFMIVFISYTMMNKLLAIESFQSNILKTGLFSNILTIVISYFVIFVELAIVLFLIFQKKIGLILLLLMLSTFTIYITGLNLFNIYEVCGCGGILNGLQFKYHFIINILLISFSFILYYTTYVKTAQ